MSRPVASALLLTAGTLVLLVVQLVLLRRGVDRDSERGWRWRLVSVTTGVLVAGWGWWLLVAVTTAHLLD